MPARAYRLTPRSLSLTGLTGPTLDAVSLKLPEGIYTTLRTYERDRIIGLSAHLGRLIDSHAAVNKPRPIDLAAIRAGLRQIIERETAAALRLRITTPFESEAVYISVEPFESFPAEFYARGVRCATSHLERATPTAKHTSFIQPSRAEKAGTDPEIHELLMVNEAGEILEGFSSNYYAVMNGTLLTAGAGVLEGVTRQIVLAEAKEIIPVRLTPIHVSDLPNAAESFITSSGREVMPVRQVDDVVFEAPGPVTKALMARYRAHILREAERL
ncbi:MAG TPA: aminotransferase class IV [Anaerolineales bacterium]|nr:aminotransferase class IV [Anaerolineales bacterium]